MRQSLFRFCIEVIAPCTRVIIVWATKKVWLKSPPLKKEWERRGSPDSKKKSRSSAAAASAGGGDKLHGRGGGKGETSRRPKQMLEWEGEGRKEGAFFFSFPRSKLSALERRRRRRSALASLSKSPLPPLSPSQARRRRRRRRRRRLVSKAAPPPPLLGRAPSCLSRGPVLVLEVSGGREAAASLGGGGGGGWREEEDEERVLSEGCLLIPG